MLDHRASICYWMLESSLHVDWRQPLAFSRSRWPSIYYRIETSSKDDLTHAFHHPLRIPYAYTRVLALAREYGWTVEYLDSRLVSRSSHGVPQITALFFTYVHRIDEFHAVRVMKYSYIYIDKVLSSIYHIIHQSLCVFHAEAPW